MRPQSAKSKGRRLQQDVAKKLRETMGLHEDDIVSRPMGSPGEDLMLSPAARSLIPFSFECKNVEKLNIWEAIGQARDNCRGHTPAVAFTKNREDVYIAMPIDKFLEMLCKINGK